MLAATIQRSDGSEGRLLVITKEDEKLVLEIVARGIGACIIGTPQQVKSPGSGWTPISRYRDEDGRCYAWVND